MRALLLTGCVTLAFGLGAYQVLGELGLFNTANIAIGLLSLAGALGLASRRLGQARRNVLRGPALDAALGAVATVWATIALQVAVSESDLRFDWTFERSFEIAPATHAALDRLADEPLTITLYFQDGDPRLRRTRMLLGEMTRGRDLVLRERRLDDFPDDEDRFGIGSSNSVVLVAGDRWELVERPTQGALFEGLSLLGRSRQGLVYATVGAGEGNLERSDPMGYSGLWAALETEGYRVRPLPMAVASEVPNDADAVLMLSPDRTLPDTALGALERYVARGGSLLAFLDPGRDSGLEGLLARQGLTSPNVLVVDPTSGPIEGDPPGVNPIAFNYAAHPVTHGLGPNRMMFFRGVRPITLRKVRPDDRLQRAVLSSRDAWLQPDPSLPPALLVQRPPDARGDYRTLVAAATLELGDDRQARIVAFGDSDFASNRYLRTLYNLDLVMNAVHWAVRREPAITLRPKGGQLLQFPVPIQSSLEALYGVGLVVPELLLLTGGLIWLRQRAR